MSDIEKFVVVLDVLFNGEMEVFYDFDVGLFEEERKKIVCFFIIIFLDLLLYY